MMKGLKTEILSFISWSASLDWIGNDEDKCSVPAIEFDGNEVNYEYVFVKVNVADEKKTAHVQDKTKLKKNTSKILQSCLN